MRGQVAGKVQTLCVVLLKQERLVPNIFHFDPLSDPGVVGMKLIEKVYPNGCLHIVQENDQLRSAVRQPLGRMGFIHQRAAGEILNIPNAAAAAIIRNLHAEFGRFTNRPVGSGFLVCQARGKKPLSAHIISKDSFDESVAYSDGVHPISFS